MSDDTETDDAADLRADWNSHPYTKAWVRKFALERNESLRALLGAAMKSTDPEVRGAFQQFNEREVMLKWLTAAPK